MEQYERIRKMVVDNFGQEVYDILCEYTPSNVGSIEQLFTYEIAFALVSDLIKQFDATPYGLQGFGTLNGILDENKFPNHAHKAVVLLRNLKDVIAFRDDEIQKTKESLLRHIENNIEKVWDYTKRNYQTEILSLINQTPLKTRETMIEVVKNFYSQKLNDTIVLQKERVLLVEMGAYLEKVREANFFTDGESLFN